MEYYTVKTGNTILPFAETWMGLKGIMLSKKANTVCFTYRSKFLKMNEYSKRKTDSQRTKLVVIKLVGRGSGVGQNRRK